MRNLLVSLLLIFPLGTVMSAAPKRYLACRMAPDYVLMISIQGPGGLALAYAQCLLNGGTPSGVSDGSF